MGNDSPCPAGHRPAESSVGADRAPPARPQGAAGGHTDDEGPILMPRFIVERTFPGGLEISMDDGGAKQTLGVGSRQEAAQWARDDASRSADE